MDLLKLLTEESVLRGSAFSKSALADLIAGVADTHFCSAESIESHRRSCHVFFPDDFDFAGNGINPNIRFSTSTADGVAAFYLSRVNGKKFDPAERPGNETVVEGYEVRSAEVNGDPIVFILPAWLEDRP